MRAEQYGLSDETKKQIEDSGLLQLRQKLEIFLVCAEEKPSTILEIRGDTLKDVKTYQVSQRQERTIKNLLQNLGLAYELMEKHVCLGEEPPHEEVLEIAISKFQRNIEKLLAAIEGGYEGAEGRCYGFDYTSILAWLEKIPPCCRKISPSNPKCLLAERVFSRDYFDEEWETVGRWYRLIGKISPITQREMVRYAIRHDYKQENPLVDWV
jgi:hypothetical protein